MNASQLFVESRPGYLYIHLPEFKGLMERLVEISEIVIREDVPEHGYLVDVAQNHQVAGPDALPEMLAFTKAVLEASAVHPASTRIAVLVAADKLALLGGATALAAARGLELRLFIERDEAEAWLRG